MTNGTALAMTYTGDSQVARVTAGSDSFAYSVLGLGAKTNGSTTYYTRDNAGTLVGERIGSNSYYYLFDGLGSVVAVTGSAGTALDTYTYDPYGQVTLGGSNSVANPWQYTSGYLDSQTGLVKLGQRFYDPSLGRWTQQDPVPQGNLYVYAGDNPVNFTDLSGTFPSLSSIGQEAQTLARAFVQGADETAIATAIPAGATVIAQPELAPAVGILEAGAILGGGAVNVGFTILGQIING